MFRMETRTFYTETRLADEQDVDKGSNNDTEGNSREQGVWNTSYARRPADMC